MLRYSLAVFGGFAVRLLWNVSAKPFRVFKICLFQVALNMFCAIFGVDWTLFVLVEVAEKQAKSKMVENHVYWK